MASRYQMFRRILAPIAVVLALALLAHQSCGEERADVWFGLDFGVDAPEVRHVRVDVWAGDDALGFYEKSYGQDGAVAPTRWKQPLPRADVEATITVTLASGEVATHRRKVHAPGGSEVILDASR